jgi:hypothetical protein
MGEFGIFGKYEGFVMRNCRIGFEIGVVDGSDKGVLRSNIRSYNVKLAPLYKGLQYIDKLKNT